MFNILENTIICILIEITKSFYFFSLFLFYSRKPIPQLYLFLCNTFQSLSDSRQIDPQLLKKTRLTEVLDFTFTAICMLLSL